MRMSDAIEAFIKDLLKGEEEFIEIQRNDLAEYFNCVPSQINYVIQTRFKPSQGYYVESKRRRPEATLKLKKLISQKVII